MSALNLPKPAGALSRSQEFLLKIFSFTNYGVNAFIAVIFPVYFHMLGFSSLQFGMLYSIGPTVGIIANLVWGVTSDRFQTIKKIITIILSGQLVFILLMFRAEAYPVIFVLLTLYYFFQTPVNMLNDSQILLHTKQTGKSYASYRVWGSIGFAVAALLFGLLLKTPTHGKMALLCIGNVALALLLSLLLKDARGAGFKKMQFTGLGKVLLAPRLTVFLLLVLLLAVAARINDGFLSLYLLERGAGQAVIGSSWMVSALSEIPLFLLLSRYGDRFRELPLLAFAGLMYTVRFFLMSLPLTPGMILAVQTMHSLSFGIFLITALRYLQGIVPDRFRATGQAVFNVTWGSLSGLIGGFLGGQLFDVYGGHEVYLTATAFAGISTVGFFVFGRLSLRKSAEESL